MIKKYKKIANICAMQINNPEDIDNFNSMLCKYHLEIGANDYNIFLLYENEMVDKLYWGDYVVWNEDNLNDVWIIDKETFEKTYKEIK